jgi:hypothetical protein
VTYADVLAIFTSPPGTPIDDPVVPATPARRLRDALEPIATQGWWSPEVGARIEALGLGFFDGYVWGRAASLGTPTAAVVVSAFGVFDPAMLTGVYEQAVSVAGRDEVLAAREAGATEAVASVIDDESASAIADPLLAVLDQLDATGRPLFNALRQLPRPAAPAGRLWRAAELVREHRGDGHLAAIVTGGIDVASVNVLTELWLGYGVGEYSFTRGLDRARLDEIVAGLEARELVTAGALTPTGRSWRDELEATTDRAQQHLVAALGDRLDAIVDASSAISASLVAGGHAPRDPRKLAAG